MSSRRAGAFHTPGTTRDYPFDGRYRNRAVLNHGHSGAAHAKLATYLGLRIRGSNIVVEHVDASHNDLVEYAVAAPAVGGAPRAQNYHQYRDEVIHFPNDGRTYDLKLHTSRGNGAVAHRATIVVCSDNAAPRPGPAPAPPSSHATATRLKALDLPELRVMLADGREYPLATTGAPLDLPAGLDAVIAPSAGSGHVRLRPPRGTSVKASIGGEDYHGTHENPAYIPVAHAASGRPLDIETVGGASPNTTTTQLPPMNVGFDPLRDGSTLAHCSASGCRIAIASASDPSLRNEGVGSAQLTLPATTAAVTLSVWPLSSPADSSPALQQSISLPAPSKNSAAAEGGPVIAVDDQPDGSRCVRGYAETPAGSTQVSADGGRSWHPSVTVNSTEPQRVDARAVKPHGGTSGVCSVVVAKARSVTPQWLKDLVDALANAPNDGPNAPTAGDPQQLPNRLRNLRPESTEGADLVRHLMDLVGRAPQLSLTGVIDSVRSGGGNAVDVFADGVKRVTATPGETAAVPQDAQRVRVDVLAPAPRASRAVVASLEFERKKPAVVPTIEFSAPRANTLTNIACHGAAKITMKRDASEPVEITPGSTTQLNSGQRCVLTAVDAANTPLANCACVGAVPDSGDAAADSSKQQNGSEWDGDYLDLVLKTLKAHRGDRNNVRLSMLPLAPKSECAKTKELHDGLVDLLAPGARMTLALNTTGNIERQTVTADSQMLVADASVQREVVVPENTRRLEVSVAAGAGGGANTRPPPPPPPRVLFDVGAGCLANVRTSDADALVFAMVDGATPKRVEHGSAVPAEPVARRTTVELVVEKPAGTILARQAVTVDPASPQQKSRELADTQQAATGAPASLAYSVGNGQLRDVRFESLSSDALPEVDLRVSVDGATEVPVGPGHRPVNLPSRSDVELKIRAYQRGSGRRLAETTARIPPASAPRAAVVKAAVGFRRDGDEALLDVASPSHTVHVRTTNGYPGPQEPGALRTIRFDAHSQHTADITFTDEDNEPAARWDLRLPALISRPQPPLDFRVELRDGTLALRPLNGGVAVGRVGSEPAERNFAEPVAVGGGSGDDAVVAKVQLKRVVVDERTGSLSSRTAPVATLDMQLSGGGGGVDPRLLSPLQRILNSEPRPPPPGHAPDTDQWLRDMLAELASLRPHGPANKPLRELQDALGNLIARLMQRDDATIHFRLRGEQHALLDLPASAVA